MADIMIRKRKRMRSKEVKALSKELEEVMGAPVFSEDEPVDMAESSDFGLIFVGGDILGLVREGKPFLTVRGIMRYSPTSRYVTVDMGAVPFVTNGADVMGPGILEADPSVAEGDLVWIRDVRNKMPLAVGVSLRSAEGLCSKEPGKAIKTIHYVGDKLWKTGERGPSALYHAYGDELRHLRGEPGPADDLHDLVDVLVRVGGLLQDALVGAVAEVYPALGHPSSDVPHVKAPDGFLPGHLPSRAVAGRPEGLLHRALPPGQDVRPDAHVAWDYDRLADVPVA